MNREVNVAKRVQTRKGLRYCSVVLAGNGRIKPNTVMVDGKPELHRGGAYYLEWREGTKRVRVSVGKDATDATAKRMRKEAELNAVNKGATIVPENGEDGNRPLAALVADYLSDVKLTHKPRSYAPYNTALVYFLESCHKLNLEEVERRDLLKFSVFLREEKEQAPRTVYNKFEHVMTFLKAQGVRGLVGKNVFPTSGSNPKLNFLDDLKAVAERAKLNKDSFWLHKFRATFATRCLWAGVDLRTVQQWLGHSDMESTMRYLKPSRSQETRAKVNEIFS